MKQALFAVPLSIALGASAAAQTVEECNWVAAPANIVEPWEDWSRSFADYAIRVAVVDTGGEPVCCSRHLMVLSPSGSGEHEPAYRQCRVVSKEPGLGWLEIVFDELEASYDPAHGLLVDVPAEHYDGVAGVDPDATMMLRVRINHATGAVTLE